jgi:exonuclease VII small subunit
VETAVGAVEEAVVVVEGAAVSQNLFRDQPSLGDLMDRQDAAAMAELMATLNASNASLQETITVLTTLMASMQQREQRLRDVVAEQLQVLQNAVGSADSKVNRVLENALPRLTQLTNQALTQTLEPAAKRFNKEMTTADETLQQATRRYAQAQQSLETKITRRMGLASATMLVAGVLGLGAVVYSVGIINEKRTELAKLRASIDYLDRVSRADLAPCGEGRLCATLEKNGPRYGNQRQYRAINLRATSDSQ